MRRGSLSETKFVICTGIKPLNIKHGKAMWFMNILTICIVTVQVVSIAPPPYTLTHTDI